MKDVKPLHVVMVLCSWLAAALPSLESQLPDYASYLKLAAAVLAVLTGALGTMTGKAFGNGGDQ